MQRAVHAGFGFHATFQDLGRQAEKDKLTKTIEFRAKTFHLDTKGNVTFFSSSADVVV